MSKFYLPSSTATSTTNTSPLHSPEYNESKYQTTQFAAAISETDSYASDDDNIDTLPYPTPLVRSAFLDPSFSPQAYLSTLRNRHQTLEDLRSDLRSRVQDLSKELFDLVNAEYEDFLGVGQTLMGGEEKVEEVRVGVLGFRREIEGVRGLVKARAGEVKGLVDERRSVRREVVLGRKLLELGDRVDELEGRLKVGGGGGNDGRNMDEEDDDEDEDEDEFEEYGDMAVGLSRLTRHAQLYLQTKQMMDHIGQHPFLRKLEPRLDKVRTTLLLDLGAGMKQAVAAGSSGGSAAMKIAAIYRELGEGGEAIRVLKGR